MRGSRRRLVAALTGLAVGGAIAGTIRASRATTCASTNAVWELQAAEVVDLAGDPAPEEKAAWPQVPYRLEADGHSLYMTARSGGKRVVVLGFVKEAE